MRSDFGIWVFAIEKNDKWLPGSPDIAILKYKFAIFVDGEFWHGKDWETRRATLKKNREYWIEKIEENIDCDKRVDVELNTLGWRVLRYWEKDILKQYEDIAQEIVQIMQD